MKKYAALNYLFPLLQLIFVTYIFKEILFTNSIWIRGDLQQPLTIRSQIMYYLYVYLYSKVLIINVPKIIFTLPFYIVSLITGDILAFKIFLIAIMYISWLILYRTLRRIIIILDKESFISFFEELSLYISSLFFILNPWTLSEIIAHPWFILSNSAAFAFTFLIINFIINTSHKINIKQIIYILLLLLGILTTPQIVFLILLILITAFLVFHHEFLKMLKIKKKNICSYIFLLIAFLAPIWLPTSILTFSSKKSFSSLSYGAVIENYLITMKRQEPIYVISGTFRFAFGEPYTPNFGDTWYLINGVLLFVLIVLGIYNITLKIDQRNTDSIGKKVSIYIIFLWFLLLSFFLWSRDFIDIIMKLPFGYAFREPWKFYGYHICLDSVFLCYLMTNMLNKFACLLRYAILAKEIRIAKKRFERFLLRQGISKAVYSTILIIIILNIGFHGWIAFTGDFNSYAQKHLFEYPSSYAYLAKLLNSSEKYNVLVLPQQYDYGVYGKILEAFLVGEGYYIDLDEPLRYKLIENSLSLIELKDLLNLTACKIVILRKDLSNSDLRLNINNLREKLELIGYKKKFEDDVSLIFLSKNIQGKIKIYPKEKIACEIEPGTFFVPGVIIVPVRNPILSIFIKTQPMILPLYEERMYNELENLGKEQVILVSPYHFSNHHNPSFFWSRGSYSGGLGNEFLSYLYLKYSMKSWQSDYSYGIVFTWANLILPESINFKDQDIIRSWAFEKERDLNEWRNSTPRIQFGALQELILKDESLIAVLWNSTWGWKLICSPRIRVSYPSAYRFVLRVKGEHAYKVHVKVAEFDANGKWLAGVYLGGVGSGSFEWKTISFDYITQSENVSYIQLQIWHGYDTPEPLPNIIWIDYVKVYNLTKYARPVVLEIPFKVNEEGYYRLFIRYFKNQRGGAVRVYLDGRPIEIITKDQLNKFVWRDLGLFLLRKGRHKIVLENVRGFNAVNLFALIPEDEYERAKENVRRLLQNKTVIYLFEAESDLYRSNAEISNEFGNQASNGEVLKFLGEGEAWQKIEMVKEGWYRLALRGKGHFRVSIANYTFELRSDTLDFVYTPLFYIPEGLYELRIFAGENSYLDVVWLYSTETNQTINQLFEVKSEPAKIISYERVNPMLWKVRVNAVKPFMLSFAEAYDPLWEARVYKDGKLVETVSSIPLYAVINGFWIDEVGELEIIIRYTPQDWFELGLRISSISFFGCIFYLFYDWRLAKGDAWAIYIHRRLKRFLRRLKKKLLRSE